MYCLPMGLLSPSSCFFWSMTLCGAWPPSIALTGSPGMTRSTTKIRVTMINTIGMVRRIRVNR